MFVHISAVERAGLSTLNEGQQIEYLWYTFEYRCQDGTRLDMDLTKARLEVEQVE